MARKRRLSIIFSRSKVNSGQGDRSADRLVVERRNEGYYVAGTNISLDSVARALKRSEAVDEILADFPAVGTRQKVEAAIAFIDAHPREIESYLAAAVRAWEEARKLNPAEFVERVRRFRERRVPKPA
jgi:uncharacterized protein (DUF433 family)